MPRSLVEELSRVGATGGGFPVLSQTPLYMRESLVFPYTEGMKFQDSIYRKLGAGAFERIFREAPLSSQEILHPEQYADKVIPTHPELPHQAAGIDWGRYKELARGDVGEFDFLDQLVNDPICTTDKAEHAPLVSGLARAITLDRLASRLDALLGLVARRKTGAIGNPEDMRIDRDGEIGRAHV